MNRIVTASVGRPARERGGILITVLMVIVVMLILAVPFLVKLSAENRSTERASRALTALNLAEAGVDKVMWGLDPLTAPSNEADTERIEWDYSGTNDVGVIPPLADPPAYIKTNDGRDLGFVQVVLTPPVGVEPNPQTRLLDSTGRVPFIADNTVDRTVRVTLMREYKSIFDVGFFVDEYFYIRNGYFLDAYDSRDGAYGAALAGGGTNSLLPDVYFGSNSYIDYSNPRDPGDATWVIGQGGGSNQIHGTIMAGGDAAEAYNNGTATNPPDPSLLESVINVPSEGIFLGDEDRIVMSQEYELPPVDVYNLPPKEMLGSIPPVGDWFDGYNETSPELSTGYYSRRLDSPPLKADIVAGMDKGTFSTAVNGSSLTPASNGVYTSFQIGGAKTSGTVNISGGDVVIYVTSYGDVSQAASFFMGPNSSINIAEGSSLTLILGNTSVTGSQGYSINAQGDPAQAANCVILGTNQFAVPENRDISNLPNKAESVDKLGIPGLIYFEHGQGGEPNGRIYAATYVPSASLTTGQGQNHMDYYGALITKSMEFKVQVDFHYDKALADMKIVNGGFEYWTIINWVELVGGN